MASHALGAQGLRSQSCRLAAPDDPAAVAGVVKWAQSHASPAARDVLRKLPARTRATGMLAALVIELQQGLTGDR
jgi:hypothetical protein